jgi:ligand-binding SRPBCC domain-containing protein
MRLFHFYSSLWLPRSREVVFDYFAEARNLELLTPPWLSFRILTTAPVEMRVGTRIDYRLKLHGIPLRWQSEITDWDPPSRFVDVQRHGPYRRWVHEHRFAERDGGTLVLDRVTYAVFGGRPVQRLFVAPDLRKIFAYRRDSLVTTFGAEGARAAPRPSAPSILGEVPRLRDHPPDSLLDPRVAAGRDR